MAMTAPIPTIPVERPKMEQPAHERLGDYASIAFHGVAAAVAQKRLDRAADRMERMDHKNALYADLGKLAMTGARTTPAVDTVDGKPPMPRTIVERFVDRRYNRKSLNKSIADLRVYRAQQIYGPSDQLRGVTPNERKHGKKFGLTSDELESATANGLLRRNTGVHFGNPMIAGTKDLKREVKQGTLLSRDVRTLKTQIEAQPLKLGAEEHKLQAKRSRRASRKARHAANQRVLRKWRNFRQERAIGAIQEQSVSQERHTDARDQRLAAFREQTEKRRQVRRERRVYYKAKAKQYGKQSLEFAKRNAPKAKNAAKAVGRGTKVVARKSFAGAAAVGRKIKRK